MSGGDRSSNDLDAAAAGATGTAGAQAGEIEEAPDVTPARPLIATLKKAPPAPPEAAPVLARIAAATAQQEEHDPSAPAPGRVLGGKVHLVRLLGAGGMGQVWKGEHLLLGVPVAVKTMHPRVASNPDDRRRFLREARAASLLRHPNVVQILDVGEDTGLLYIVMEYLHGMSLGAFLRGSQVLPPLKDVASILESIFDALEVAHACGIVHRDLKPENVLLAEVGGKRIVKVVDFGLAHMDDELDQGPTLTSRDTVAGTPEYMSPEQCRSLAVGPSADLYAMGCILTTMLQGTPPFSCFGVVETFAQHLFSPPPPLQRPAHLEPVPPLLERLRLDLLAKSPDRRPRNASEARDRLYEALSPEAAARRLPSRKAGEPLGDRMDRVPAWTATDRALAPDLPISGRVALLDLPAGGDVRKACATGLNAHGLALVDVADAASLSHADVQVVVLDAGPDVAGACAFLADLSRTAPRLRAVVCASDLTAERMNALVAAGAADVVRHPVTPDMLSRKVLRVLRRGR